MSSEPATRAWLARVRHDLVKRLLWPARDRRDLGGAVRPGELAVAFTDDEGQPATAQGLWQTLRAAAPPTCAAPALDVFAAALDDAVAAARRDDLAGVLALEPAFEALARNVK